MSESTRGIYRKKPVEIEAVQFDGTWESVNEFADCKATFIGGPHPTFVILTLEGNMTAEKGDWIIKGIKGEFYPCKPDIFAATYDLVALQQPDPSPATT